MRLYRGIAVPRNQLTAVISDSRMNKLVSGQGKWTMIAHYLKPKIEEIWLMPLITYAATRPDSPTPPWVCACSDETGARYYACQHNYSGTNNSPILISFDADPRDVIIDGRDFLYTTFQLGEPLRARPIA